MKFTRALTVVGAFSLLFPCLAARGESVRISDRQTGDATLALQADSGDARDVECADSSILDRRASDDPIGAVASRASDAADNLAGSLLGWSLDAVSPDLTLVTRGVVSALVSTSQSVLPQNGSVGVLPQGGSVEPARMSLVSSTTAGVNLYILAKLRSGAPSVAPGRGFAGAMR